MSAPKAYNPREGTLPHRVCMYFARQPMEELSSADIAVKWDVVPTGSVSPILSAAVSHQFLQRKAGVYSAGPQLAQWAARVLPGLAGNAWPPIPSAERAAGSNTAESAAQTATSSRFLPPLDVESLAIVPAAPPPVQRPRPPPSTDWDALFRRLPPGHGVESLPQRYHKAARTAAAKYCKAHPEQCFAIRLLPDQRCGIYRIK